MSKIHFVVITLKECLNDPEFGVLLEEDDGKRRFFTMYKGEPLEYEAEKIEYIRFAEKREFGESGPSPGNPNEWPIPVEEFCSTRLEQRNMRDIKLDKARDQIKL